MQDPRLEKLKENLRGIQDQLHRAAERKGRDPQEITLVGVTKSVEPDVAGLLIEAGVDHIGENRVKEAERKRSVLGSKGIWHMIGHLQTNKVRRVIPLFSMIHSVDSLRLLQEISKRSDPKEKILEILLEVNVSGEASKYGFSPSQFQEAVRLARDLPGVSLRGLMTMAPYDPDPETARPYFINLRDLLSKLQDAGEVGSECNLLSMGMSGDFEVAVEEGATHVRIGTALFEGLDDV